MNILFLSEQIYPHASGAELATYLHAKLLSDAGFNVRIVTNKFPKEDSFSQDGHIEIYRLPMFASLANENGTAKYQILSRADLLFSSFLNRMIDWADVVYVPRFWFSAIPLAKAHRKPVITHLHDYVAICPLVMAFDSFKVAPCKGHGLICSPKCTYCCEKSLNNRSLSGTLASISLNSLSGPLFSGLMGLSDAIVCVSNAQKDIVTQSGLFPSQKLSLVHNPIPEFSSLPLKGDDFGYFGGLETLRGFQTLYHAAVSLGASSKKPFRIYSTKFPQIKKQYVDCLEKSGFCVYGRLEKKAYDELYQKIRAVIVPSRWYETWSYVVVEALLNGRYVIASRIGGIPEVVDTCRGVSLVEPGNSEALKDAMDYVLNLDNDSLFKLGRQNRDAFLSRFSNDKCLKEFVGVLDSVA